MAKEKKTIAVVIYPGMTALDLVGTLEALMPLNLRSPYRTVAVGERAEAMPTDTPLQLVPQRSFAEVPSPHALVVPGAPTLDATRDAALIRYVQTAGATAELVVSVGTGSLVLAAAGLLAGRRATTHWAHARRLEAFGIRYVRRRWVEDGKFVTAAGVTAGIDAALHVVAKLTSPSRARRAQLVIEYDPQPPFGGIDWDRVDRELAGAAAAAGGDGDAAPHGDLLVADTNAKERV
jgi:transcriptional regulator GlxA family with amidase domain